jgi:hypothetical protein
VDLPESQRIYRYWVELHNRSDGSVRVMPLGGIKRIHLVPGKGEARHPDEVVLQVQDESTVIEAKDLEDLAAQLREKYLDEMYERFLHQERDVEAERRKAEAMDGLIQLLADAVVEDILRQETEPS